MSSSGSWLTAGAADDPLVVLRSGFWHFNAIGIIGQESALVVDPGIEPDEIARLRRSLETRRSNGPRPISHVVLTHSHHDHIRGWRDFPGARVVMPRIAAEKPEGARTRIIASVRAIDEHLGVDAPDFAYPSVDDVFDESITLELGACEVELRFLPGHSNCTSVVWIPSCRTLLTADYLVSPGLPYCRWQVPAFEEALRTLARWCREWDVQRIIPAHNAILERGGLLPAIAEDLRYFAVLREVLHEELARADETETALRRAAKAMGVRRGKKIGGSRRQDLDNARRVLEEIGS